MACGYGRNNAFILVGEESDFNTPVTTTKDLGILSDWNFDGNNNNILVTPAPGERELSDIQGGQFEGTVGINGVLNSGAIFEMFFGQATDTETTGDYNHVFIDSAGSETVTNVIKSYTMSNNLDSTTDLVQTASGCSVNTVDLSVTVGEIISVSSEIWGSGIADTTSAGTKVTTTTKPLSYSNIGITSGAEGAGSLLTQVQSFDISLSNNLQRVPSGLGFRTDACHLVGNLPVTGNMELTFGDHTMWERFLGGTSQSTSGQIEKSEIIMDANNGVVLGSGRLDLYIKLYGVVFDSSSIIVPEEGPINVSLPYTATTIKNFSMTDAVATYF
jgi:hypothetical protein